MDLHLIRSTSTSGIRLRGPGSRPDLQKPPPAKMAPHVARHISLYRTCRTHSETHRQHVVSIVTRLRQPDDLGRRNYIGYQTTSNVRSPGLVPRPMRCTDGGVTAWS